jgi:hypothetical protein
VRIEVSLTKREADELLRCEVRRMFSGGHAYSATQSQQAATFKLREAVIAAQRGEKKAAAITARRASPSSRVSEED